MKFIMRVPDIYRSVGDHRASAFILMLLRVAVGSIFIVHGWHEVSDVPGTIGAFRDLGLPAVAAYFAITVEVFGGIGLLLGALTSLSALGPAVAMAFAISFVHGGRTLFADSDGWEYPLLLFLLCVYFAVHGAGAYSVDALFADSHRRFRRRHRRVAAST